MPKYAFGDIKKGEDQGLLKKQGKAQSVASPKKEKKPLGRPADPEGTTVRLTLSTIPRPENGPFIIINGSGKRDNTKVVNVPVPLDLYDRVKSCGNISASLVALMRYGLEQLDASDKTLWATYEKSVDDTK